MTSSLYKSALAGTGGQKLTTIPISHLPDRLVDLESYTKHIKLVTDANVTLYMYMYNPILTTKIVTTELRLTFQSFNVILMPTAVSHTPLPND